MRVRRIIMAFWASVGLIHETFGWVASAAAAWGHDVPAFLWFGILTLATPLVVIGFWAMTTDDIRRSPGFGLGQ